LKDEMKFRHDGKMIGQNSELWTVRFGYWKTETELLDGFLQTPKDFHARTKK